MSKSSLNQDYKRLVAYDDFRNLDPGSRSVQALFDLYILKNRNGEDVPTTNRTQLYKWSQEDDWRTRLAEDEKTRQEYERAALLKNRKRQLGKFASMLDDANEALLAIIREAKDDATRLRAVTALFDRLGFTPVSKNFSMQRELEEANQERNESLKVSPVRPEEGASEEAWAEYTRQLREVSR